MAMKFRELTMQKKGIALMRLVNDTLSVIIRRYTGNFVVSRYFYSPDTLFKKVGYSKDDTRHTLGFLDMVSIHPLTRAQNDELQFYAPLLIQSDSYSICCRGE